MRVWVLGSGSGGNAVLVEAAGGRVLVDAGFGVRTLAERLRAIGVAPESIEACVITHEHTDHLKGAAAAARRWGWTLHATRGTISNAPELAGTRVCAFDAGSCLAFSTMDLATARTPHDAAEPVGVTMTARSTGVRTTVCT
ncbi:MAG: MBL fold metallo-hydrolase, partial [Gemmatimonadaceae bacterium]